MPCFSNVGAILKCVDFETIQAVPLVRLIILIYGGWWMYKNGMEPATK